MSTENGPLEIIGEARAALGRAKESLLSPSIETLESAAPLLKETADHLARLKAYMEEEASETNKAQKESSGHLRFLAEELGRDLNDVKKLTEQAGGFYLGCAGIVLSRAGSYTANGETKPPPGCHRVSVDG